VLRHIQPYQEETTVGYETKMFVVREYEFITKGDERYGEIIGMVDLCKCGSGEFSQLMRRSKDAQTKKFCLWSLPSERQQEAIDFIRTFPDKRELADQLASGKVVKDLYDDVLGVMPIDDVIAALRKDYKSDLYRRYAIALALLESVKTHFDGEKVVIVTYGY